MPEQKSFGEWVLWAVLLVLAFAVGGFLSNRKKIHWLHNPSALLKSGGAADSGADSQDATMQTDVQSIPAIRIKVGRPHHR
ncbi:MAG: hypothetical protein KGL04_04275 [Elusimicrobia bacterium]|nr:hypothetical protein [Elusimicrobiota bacterium]MDE2313374.1 hypothetical protein [Elusimicrobiota bacterium]